MKAQHSISEVLTMPPRVDKQSFRDAMSTLAAAVNVVTTDGPGGRAGFTATAVCSVCDEPPTLLVCLNRGASVYDVFSRNDALCVNTLTDTQSDLSNLFGGKSSMEERFAAATWEQSVTGAPVLEDAWSVSTVPSANGSTSVPMTSCSARWPASVSGRTRAALSTLIGATIISKPVSLPDSPPSGSAPQ